MTQPAIRATPFGNTSTLAKSAQTSVFGEASKTLWKKSDMSLLSSTLKLTTQTVTANTDAQNPPRSDNTMENLVKVIESMASQLSILTAPKTAPVEAKQPTISAKAWSKYRLQRRFGSTDSALAKDARFVRSANMAGRESSDDETTAQRPREHERFVHS